MSVRQGDCLVLEQLTYIPAIKCASSTMRQALTKLGAKESNYLKHPEVLDNEVLFITRHPVARFISAYNHCHGWAYLGTPQEELAKEPMFYHFLPQTWFLTDVQPTIWGEVENMDWLSNLLDMHLPQVNQGQHNVFKRYDCPGLVTAIAIKYEKDYELLAHIPAPERTYE